MSEHFLSSDNVANSLSELRSLLKKEAISRCEEVGVDQNSFNHWEWDIPSNINELNDDQSSKLSSFFHLCQYLRIIDEKIGKE